MDENMKELCDAHGVDFTALYDEVCIKSLNGVTRSLTQDEWKVLRCALEIAGGL